MPETFPMPVFDEDMEMPDQELLQLLFILLRAGMNQQTTATLVSSGMNQQEAQAYMTFTRRTN